MGQPFSSYMKPLERAAAVAVISAVAGGALYLPEHFLKQGNLNNLVHLLSFSTWVGTQFWVTFIAGFVMIKVLPRHMFGLAQSRLFPAYFLAGTALSSITLSTYLVQNPFLRWKGHTLTTTYVATHCPEELPVCRDMAVPELRGQEDKFKKIKQYKEKELPLFRGNIGQQS